MQPRNSCLVARFVMLHAIKHAHDHSMHNYTLLYAEKSLGTWCLRHRAARLTSLVRLVRVQPRTRSSRAVPTMLVPSMSPAQGHMQVCVIVRAPGAARGADSLRIYSGHMPGLAEGYGGAPGHAHLEMGSAATSSRARDGAPAQMASNGTRSRDASQ